MCPLAVTGIGMVSALGLDAVTSCAAARAHISRMVESDDLFVEDVRGHDVAPATVSQVPHISAGMFGFSRLLQLGLAAIADLQCSDGLRAAGRTGAILLVGDGRYREAWHRRELAEAAGEADRNAAAAKADGARATHDHIAKALLATLVLRSGLAVDPKLRVTLAAGAAGLVSAIAQAEQWLVRGECDRCVVGGIDSLIDPPVLAALEGLGLLRTPNRAVGMFPGEAASFLLLERSQDVKARGDSPAALLGAEARGSEAAHPVLLAVQSREPSDGATGDDGGLRDAIVRARSALPDRGASTALAVVNLNGDPYRATAWGRSVIQTRSALGWDAVPLWIPPLHFGDIGAATGPVALVMLARGWARGYTPRPSAIVCLMDDCGARGAISVRIPEEVNV